MPETNPPKKNTHVDPSLLRLGGASSAIAEAFVMVRPAWNLGFYWGTSSGRDVGSAYWRLVVVLVPWSFGLVLQFVVGVVLSPGANLGRPILFVPFIHPSTSDQPRMIIPHREPLRRQIGSADDGWGHVPLQRSSFSFRGSESTSSKSIKQ